jgi:hypothetical protein
MCPVDTKTKKLGQFKWMIENRTVKQWTGIELSSLLAFSTDSDED